MDSKESKIEEEKSEKIEEIELKDLNKSASQQINDVSEAKVANDNDDDDDDEDINVQEPLLTSKVNDESSNKVEDIVNENDEIELKPLNTSNENSTQVPRQTAPAATTATTSASNDANRLERAQKYLNGRSKWGKATKGCLIFLVISAFLSIGLLLKFTLITIEYDQVII